MRGLKCRLAVLWSLARHGLAAIIVGLPVALFCTEVHAGPYAYITNNNSDSVSVIDTATNTVVTTIATPGAPVGVTFNSSGTRAYITRWAMNSVSVVDTATHSVVGDIPVGINPYGIAANPSGTRVYVANFNGHTVSVIDAGTNSVIATILTGKLNVGVAMSPSGARLYVANGPDNTVTVIDTASNLVVAAIPVGGDAWGIAVNPAGTRLYLSMSNTNDVRVVDTAANAVIATIPINSRSTGIAVDPTGAHTYVSAFDPPFVGVRVIDNGTNTVVATASLPVSAFPMGLALNDTSSRVYVANQVLDNVSVIDTATNAVVATIPVGSHPFAVGQFIQPLAPPSLSKVFNPAIVAAPGATTGLTFTLANPPANGAALNGVAFTDTLPPGMHVSSPNGLTGSCGGGTITAVPLSGSVSLSGAALPVNASCTFSVNVTTTGFGTYVNSIGNVSATNSPTTGSASAQLEVGGTPVPTLSTWSLCFLLAAITLLAFVALLRRRARAGNRRTR